MKRRQKGDPPEPGAGRPPGSRSFKALLNEAMEQIEKGEDGKPIPLKKKAAVQILAILLSKETDDQTKLKAFALIRDTIGEAPTNKNEHSGEIQVKTRYVLPDGTAIDL